MIIAAGQSWYGILKTTKWLINLKHNIENKWDNYNSDNLHKPHKSFKKHSKMSNINVLNDNKTIYHKHPKEAVIIFWGGFIFQNWNKWQQERFIKRDIEKDIKRTFIKRETEKDTKRRSIKKETLRKTLSEDLEKEI